MWKSSWLCCSGPYATLSSSQFLFELNFNFNFWARTLPAVSKFVNWKVVVQLLFSNEFLFLAYIYQQSKQTHARSFSLFFSFRFSTATPNKPPSSPSPLFLYLTYPRKKTPNRVNSFIKHALAKFARWTGWTIKWQTSSNFSSTFFRP